VSTKTATDKATPTDAAPENAAVQGAETTDAIAAQEPVAAQQEREAFRVGRPRPTGASNVRGIAGHMARCLETLGLRPGASLDEINTTYYTLIKRFPENPTEADEALMRDVRRAYETLRRGYKPPVSRAPRLKMDKRLAIPLMAVATVALAGVLLWLNWGNIQLKMTHYEPGQVLRLKSASAPFGTIVGYESVHRYPLGRPGPAYEVRLEGKTETVWVSERLIVNGMVPVGK